MLYKEMSIHDFEPWSGAVNTYERLKRNDKLNTLEWSLSEIFGKDDIEETELNDLLWFEPDTVYEIVGLNTESEIEEEIEDINEKIEDEERFMEILESKLEEYGPGTEEWQNIRTEIVGRKLEIESLNDEKRELERELSEI